MAAFHSAHAGCFCPPADTPATRSRDQDADGALPCFLEEGLLLGVGFGVADRGDLLTGDTYDFPVHVTAALIGPLMTPCSYSL
jgi:hypothetical protein